MAIIIRGILCATGGKRDFRVKSGPFCFMSHHAVRCPSAWFVVLLCVGSVFAQAADENARGYVHDDNPAGQTVRDIRYVIHVRNSGDGVVTGAQLVAFAPVPQGAWQQCQSVVSSPDAHRIATNRGNAFLQLHLPLIPPFGFLDLTVQASLLISTSASPASLGSDDYLAPEDFVESDDPKLIELARHLRRESAAATAQAIHGWIVQNIGAEAYVAGERGARWTLRTRQGDCTEKAFLFAALCRAAGVPARVLAGFVCPQSRILHAAEYHNWAEFYDGTAWQTADPDRNVFGDGRDYVAVRVLGPGREEWMQGQQLVRVDGVGLLAGME
jgi:hypothetical protein